jgi:hypothetical protein
MPQRTDSKNGVFSLHLAAGSRSLSRSDCLTDCLMTTPMYFSHLLDTNHHSMPPHSPTKAKILAAKQILEIIEKRKETHINIHIGLKVQRSNVNCIFQLTYSQFNANSDHKPPTHQPTYHLSILACPIGLSVTVSSSMRRPSLYVRVRVGVKLCRRPSSILCRCLFMSMVVSANCVR